MSDTYTRVKDIEVNLTIASVAGSVGLGYPLVIAGMAEEDITYTECSSISEIVDAGFDTESEVYKACACIFAQNNKPKTVAVTATTGKVGDWLTNNVTKGFRQIIPILGIEDNTTEELITIASALDYKMLFLQVASANDAPKTQSERVVCVVYSKTGYANAAIVGASAGLSAGSITYKNLILSAIEAEDLSAAEVKIIHEVGALCVIKKAGDIVTSEGKTTDGEYIDVVDSKDYIITNIVYAGQKLLNDNKKVPYDNVGISQLENVVTNVLASAYNNGIIGAKEDGTPDYSTNFLGRSEIPAGDRASRVYNGGHFTFGLAGAIHNATINGTIVV